MKPKLKIKKQDLDNHEVYNITISGLWNPPADIVADFVEISHKNSLPPEAGCHESQAIDPKTKISMTVFSGMHSG